LLGQPAGSGQAAAPAQAAGADRLALAKKLVQAMELVQTMEASMAASQEAVGANLVESMVRSNAAFDTMNAEQRGKLTAAMTVMMKRLQERMQAELRKEMNLGEEVTSLLAPVYAGYFEADEMRKLIEFYQTPLGHKAVVAGAVTQPQVTKAMQAGLLPRMMGVMERVVREEQPAMARDMHKFVDELMKNKP